MKRSDLDTRTVLEAIRQGAAFGRLGEHHPPKVVLAALEREVRAGRIEYGTSIASPWITDEGQAWIAQDAATELTRHDQDHGHYEEDR